MLCRGSPASLLCPLPPFSPFSPPPLPALPHYRYWFLTEVYPMASGRTVVRTPIWLVRLCLRYGIGRVPIQAAALDNPNDVRFRAFQGRARRLAD